MKIKLIIFSVLLMSPLWGMDQIVRGSDKGNNKVNKNSFIEALNYRMTSEDPIVLCFEKVVDDASEIVMLKTVRKGIQAVMSQKSCVNGMVSPLSQSSGRGLGDKITKNYADDVNNGWIALCVRLMNSKSGWMTVQKYNLKFKQWDFGQQAHCTLPTDYNYTYNDLEESDMVVLNIPDGDPDSIITCFTMIRSLHAKHIPLLVNSDRRLLPDLWENIGDLFQEKDDVKIFSNDLLGNTSDDDSCEVYFRQQSDLEEDIFGYDYDSNSHYARETSSEQDNENKQSEQGKNIFDYYERLGQDAIVGEVLPDDNNDDSTKDNKSSEEKTFQETCSASVQTINTYVDNNKQVSYFSSIPRFFRNPWVISSTSVAVVSFLYYCKFVR